MCCKFDDPCEYWMFVERDTSKKNLFDSYEMALWWHRISEERQKRFSHTRLLKVYTCCSRLFDLQMSRINFQQYDIGTFILDPLKIWNSIYHLDWSSGDWFGYYSNFNNLKKFIGFGPQNDSLSSYYTDLLTGKNKSCLLHWLLENGYHSRPIALL